MIINILVSILALERILENNIHIFGGLFGNFVGLRLSLSHVYVVIPHILV